MEEGLADEVLGAVKRACHRAELILYPRTRRSVDIVAKSSDKTIFIKVAHDASEVGKQEISDLRKAKQAYDALTVITAVEYQKKELEDDVVYVKQGAVIVTPKTLENYLVRGEKPIVACIRGNYVLRINSQKLREKREALGCSRGTLADALGTSKKAIYMYERGEMYISIDRAMKLASIFGESIFEEFDFMHEDLGGSVEEKSTPRDKIEEMLFQIAKNLGHVFVNFLKLPVDAVIKGNTTISVVKGEEWYSPEPEKVEYAEKIATATNAKILLVRGPKDLVSLKRALIGSS